MADKTSECFNQNIAMNEAKHPNVLTKTSECFFHLPATRRMVFVNNWIITFYFDTTNMNDFNLDTLTLFLLYWDMFAIINE